MQNGTVLISQSVISGNVTGGNGAGIYATGPSAKVVLDRSVVSRNGVPGGFHGVYIDGGARFVATGNTVTRNGVGFNNAGGTFIIMGDNTVKENSLDVNGSLTSATRF